MERWPYSDKRGALQLGGFQDGSKCKFRVKRLRSFRDFLLVLRLPLGLGYDLMRDVFVYFL